MGSQEKEMKPQIENKSSMEILSELFSTFHAEPPLIIKQEKSDNKKHKKKKKHKSKDKKQTKKSKKRKRSSERGRKRSSERGSSESSSDLDFDFANLLVKHEETDEKKIKIEGTDISLRIDYINGTSTDTEEKDEKPVIKKIKVEDKDTKIEEGEITDEKVISKQKKHKCKHKHKRMKSKEKSNKSSSDSKSKYDNSHSSKSEDKYKDKNSFYETKDKSEFRRSKSANRHSDSKYKSRNDHNKDSERMSRYNSFYDNHRSRERSNDRHNSTDDFYKYKDKDYEYGRDNQFRSSKRSWDHSKDRNYRDRHNSPEKESNYIDKKKLLEIARKNAIQMMKSGNLPGALSLGSKAQEKVIAAIKAGGKTIEELTDFCKSLSRKEDLEEFSDPDDQKGSDSDTDKPFNHPFQIKDRPTSITMNIKNSVPLPIKSTQERTTELRMQFPVSSGQHHRKNENEWVPVEPKKDAPIITKPSIVLTKEVVPITPLVPPTESASYLSTIPMPSSVPAVQSYQPAVDIGAIVSQRLTAMRKLQENPNDVQALTQMYKSTKEVQSWAESKQQPGQFTGSVGGNFLSQAELSSGYQAWAKKDQLQSAAPLSGGMGMHLLQKMGWKPGEGLGKEKTGALEPLLLEVKLDKKGLVANEEMQKKKKIREKNAPKNIQDKHPVSLLGEYASKKKLGAPVYELCLESGPDHKKNFLFKVSLNGIDFKPNVASPNKKEAKALAASLCLQKLGIMT